MGLLGIEPRISCKSNKCPTTRPQAQENNKPRKGFAPPTFCFLIFKLQGRCSTVELPRHIYFQEIAIYKDY